MVKTMSYCVGKCVSTCIRIKLVNGFLYCEMIKNGLKYSKCKNESIVLRKGLRDYER